MRFGFRAAAICMLVLAGYALGKAQTSQRISLEVGSVNVWLGMEQEEAAKRFRDVGYEVMHSGDKLLLKNGDDAHIFWLKDGRLAFADREWITSDKSDKIDAVIGALAELATKAGNQSCAVVHSPLSSPDASSNRVFVSCGQRSVLIGKGSLMGRSYVTVSERIGGIPAKTE